jgi:TPR repeat protein
MTWVGVLLLAAALTGAPAAAPVAARVSDPEVRRALAYRNGDGMARDAARAVVLLRGAAESGVPEAMFILSQMLAAGEGTGCDPDGARRWLERAAQAEYPEALQQMAMEERDPARAAELMREAAHALQHRVQR